MYIIFSDAPLDLRLKSNLIADLLTLVGVPLCNPYTRETPKPPKSHPRPAACHLKRSSLQRLTSEEVSMLRDCREEYSRRGGFVRIFPTHDSWDLYRLAHSFDVLLFKTYFLCYLQFISGE